ncbi:histidine phosphatase superfamily [Gigaspora rosea]|uniref:Multiple inositol polyphosphate phosphatase 1 n=1 Tax=Gigaspora rosea TaxID=44941 RepID=A0A397W690_9GLOM|nr:histidine phosphatase superfamily [Gigaspora rosea]
MERNFQLIPRGENEAYFDGKQSVLRYNKFWKDVKKTRYNPECVKFQAGASSRCGASAMAFSEGLYNGDGPLGTCRNQPVYIWNIPADQDNILVMFNNCKLLNDTVFNNNSVYNEQNSTYVNTTLSPIAERMSKDYGIYPPLNPYLLPHIYNACQFWVLHFNRTDTWCSLLSELDIKKLLYYWDMTNYYLREYGNPLNEQIGCVYFTQLVNSVENYLNGSSVMVADLKNGQSYGMFPVLTTLGVHKNPFPLTADLPLSKIDEIKYSEAKTLFWSSTIYFEIYTCSDEKKSKKIRLVLNFVPLLIPGCESEYCEWSTFKKVLGNKIGCDFNKLCGNP